MAVRAAVVGIYVVVVVGVVVAINADAQNGMTALWVWSGASFALGWVARHPAALAFPFLGVPIALPFGSSEEWVGSDAPLVVMGMIFWGPLEAGVVGLGFVGRFLFEQLRVRLLCGASATEPAGPGVSGD